MLSASKMTVSRLIFCCLACFGADFNLVSLPASFNLWLASPEARFLKGKFLYANWDVDELKDRAKELESTTQLNIALGGWPFQDASYEFQVAKEGTWST